MIKVQERHTNNQNNTAAIMALVNTKIYTSTPVKMSENTHPNPPNAHTGRTHLDSVGIAWNEQMSEAVVEGKVHIQFACTLVILHLVM